MQSCCTALPVGGDVWQTERERHTERGRERVFDCEPFLELLGFLMIVSIVNLSFGD